MAAVIMEGLLRRDHQDCIWCRCWLWQAPRHPTYFYPSCKTNFYIYLLASLNFWNSLQARQQGNSVILERGKSPELDSRDRQNAFLIPRLRW
jgi:hypothetical protein